MPVLLIIWVICIISSDKKKKEWFVGNRLYQKIPNLLRLGCNLGFGYNRQNEPGKAIAGYEKAIAFNNKDPRIFQELDILYEKNKKPATERLAILEQNIQTVMKHDEAVMRLLTLYNETGAYDKAIDIMANRHFHVWEGGGEIHDIYVDSHLLKGMDLLKSGKQKEAISEFEVADLYPENLEVGRRKQVVIVQRVIITWVKLTRH